MLSGKGGRILAFSLVLAAGGAVFFRQELASGGRLATAGGEDMRIFVAVLEHWFRAFAGRERLADPLFFFPVAGVLGNTDAYLEQALVYSVFRAAGADLFAACQGAMAVLKLSGGVFTWLLLRRGLRLSAPASLFGMAAYLIWNASVVSAGHAQFFALNLVPLLFYLALAAWRRMSRLRAALPFLVGFALADAALFLSSFNLGWYFGLFMGCGGVVLLLAGLVAPGRPVLAALGARWPALLAGAGLSAAALLPFLALYLPVAAQSGAGDFAGSVLISLPRIYDIVNLGRDNLLWGDVLPRLLPAAFARPLQWELTKGIGPLAFVGVLASLPLAGWEVRRRGLSAAACWLAAAISITGLWLLSFQAGHGYLPWRAVYDHLPGAHAVRAIGRLYLFLSVPAILCLAMLVDRLAARRPVLAVLLALLLLAEQLNPAGAVYDRQTEMAYLTRIPAPPAACGAFYVAGRTPRPWVAAPDTVMDAHLINAVYPPQVDAMLIAEMTGIPTVNGFSSVFPPGFVHFDDESPDYRGQVADWMRQWGASQPLCRLDLTAARWGAPEPDPLGGLVGEDLTRLVPDHGGTCRGHVDAVASGDGRPTRAFAGWAWLDDRGEAPALVAITDPTDHILGAGMAGGQRPDVAAALPDIAATGPGWRAYIDAAQPLRNYAAYAISEDRRTACLFFRSQAE